MRTKSHDVMDKINNFINQYYSEKHESPSINTIAQNVGVAKSTAYSYLVEMDSLGMLEYDGASRTITTKMIRKFSPETISAPIVGAIPCGEPEMEEENVAEYVSLPRSLFGDGPFYILKATGDSMVDAGIEDGDMVVIQQQSTAHVGDIIAAVDECESSTLKRYAGINADSKYAVLQYCNEERYPAKEIHVKRLVVQGVARHVIKALENRY